MQSSPPVWPAISILILGYNQEKFIEEAIQSAFDQRYEGELEIVLCDDRSTDATYEIMRRMAESYSGPHRIIHHRAEQNGRVALNMNRAVSLASHPWLMRVDGDDVLHPDRARLSALAIRRYPDAVVVSGRLETFSTTPHAVLNPPDEQLRFVVNKAAHLDAQKNVHGLEWWGGMMTLSRELFTHFGPLPAHCAVLDDTMFATRALMLGSFVVVENGMMLYYRRHENNISSERRDNLNIIEFHRADQATRNYYRRGCECHDAILGEIRAEIRRQPEREDLEGLLRHFELRFTQLREQGYFWQQTWKQRRATLAVGGLSQISWNIQTLHPFLYSLFRWMKKRK